MAGVPGLAIYTTQDPENSYAVQLHHYDRLRDALDHGEKGWVELESAFGDGRVMLRVEDITALVLQTQGMVDALDAFNLQNA